MPANEQGVNLERYMLVPRTLVFLTKGEEVLLLKGSRDKRIWAGLYNGVGGHVEQGEDVLSAARREVLEETGLEPTTLWLCGTITIDTQTNPGVCVFVFKGECKEGKLKLSPEGTLEWVKFTDIERLALVPDLNVLLPKIHVMKKGDIPFSARSYYDQTDRLVTAIR
jgi:8-oxo-dGTP diphosphatase